MVQVAINKARLLSSFVVFCFSLSFGCSDVSGIPDAGTGGTGAGGSAGTGGVSPRMPELSIEPDSIDFGAVPIGGSQMEAATITNTGDVPVAGFVDGIPDDDRFSLVSTCTELTPGDSCEYRFMFEPTVNGEASSRSRTTVDTIAFEIVLTGLGIGSGSGSALWVTPLSLDFGQVPLRETSPSQTVTITNVGSGLLSMFAGGAPTDNQFSAAQNCAGGVPAGEACQYTFSFTPAQLGPTTTTSSSSTNEGDFFIELRGEGVAVGGGTTGPGLWVTPLTIDFGTVQVGATSPEQAVTIRNTGDATLTDFAGGAPTDNQFSGAQNCAGGVPAGEACQYTFSFPPSTAGTFVTESNSSTNAGPFTITLLGNSVDP